MAFTATGTGNPLSHAGGFSVWPDMPISSHMHGDIADYHYWWKSYVIEDSGWTIQIVIEVVQSSVFYLTSIHTIETVHLKPGYVTSLFKKYYDRYFPRPIILTVN